jgi:hypothetical protein
MVETSATDSITKNFEELVPKDAKKFIDDAAKWIRDNPTEATILGAAGGLLIGLTGVARIYQGAKALRSMPIVSQLVLGAVAKGFLSREFSSAAEAIH